MILHLFVGKYYSINAFAGRVIASDGSGKQEHRQHRAGG